MHKIDKTFFSKLFCRKRLTISCSTDRRRSEEVKCWFSVTVSQKVTVSNHDNCRRSETVHDLFYSYLASGHLFACLTNRIALLVFLSLVGTDIPLLLSLCKTKIALRVHLSSDLPWLRRTGKLFWIRIPPGERTQSMNGWNSHTADHQTTPSSAENVSLRPWYQQIRISLQDFAFSTSVHPACPSLRPMRYSTKSFSSAG